MNKPVEFSILIATRDRRNELEKTLTHLRPLFPQALCLVMDDGSTDGTADFVSESFPEVTVFRNDTSRGLLYCRNRLLERCTTAYAISIDDDAHFITNDPLGTIRTFFIDHPKIAVVGFRIFWGLESPASIQSNELPSQMGAYVGCGHAWRMEAWRAIPDYPEWFRFYGEEEFASIELFRIGQEIWYLPDVLVHHRVDVAARKKMGDYASRLRMSLRAGWYLFLLFYPWKKALRMMVYSNWVILTRRIVKGDGKALSALMGAHFDFFRNLPRLFRNRHALTPSRLAAYKALPPAKIYWKPEK